MQREERGKSTCWTTERRVRLRASQIQRACGMLSARVASRLLSADHCSSLTTSALSDTACPRAFRQTSTCQSSPDTRCVSASRLLTRP
eukprot:303407-Rhodomonas_salina.1